jgi:hypothetical protein
MKALARNRPAEVAAAIAVERIEEAILVIRGHRVMLDVDLAALYGVETKVLNQAVRRNAARFPADFMFQLTPEEFANLRSQFVTSRSWGGRTHLPYAFTEQGVAMLSSVLRSERAVRVNIEDPEVLFFSARLPRKVLFEPPVLAQLRVAG